MEFISKTVSKYIPHGIHLKYKIHVLQDQALTIMYLYVIPCIHSFSYACSWTTTAPEHSVSGEIPSFLPHISGFMLVYPPSLVQMLKVQVTKHLVSVKSHSRNRLFQSNTRAEEEMWDTPILYAQADGGDPYHTICWQETSLPHCLCGTEGWTCESILFFSSGLKLPPNFLLTFLKEKM